jgi:drug/metabolite transporter (DMT)-like permease
MFYKLDKNKQGEILIFTETLLWSLFPVITILSFTNLSPITSLAWSTLFATMFFALVKSYKKNWSELLNQDALKDILLVSFIIGILFYTLFFSGLKYTSAGNASIIALFEVFSSFLFFHMWRRDHIPKEHIFGAIFILIGAIIVLSPNFTEFRVGDILILSATLVAPVGNFFQQRARKLVSSETILFVRSLIATPFLFGMTYLLKETSTLFDLKQAIVIILINGFVLLGFSKILWVEGIHRISVTKANALASMGPLLTILFAWIILSDLPTVWQLSSVFPMILGVILLSTNKKPVVM